MKIDVLPSNIRTVKLRLRKSGEAGKFYADVTFPQDWVERYNLQKGENVVVCLLSKSGEDLICSDKELQEEQC